MTDLLDLGLLALALTCASVLYLFGFAARSLVARIQRDSRGDYWDWDRDK